MEPALQSQQMRVTQDKSLPTVETVIRLVQVLKSLTVLKSSGKELGVGTSSDACLQVKRKRHQIRHEIVFRTNQIDTRRLAFISHSETDHKLALELPYKKQGNKNRKQAR